MARTPRRRRSDNLTGMRAKLGVNESMLDREKFAYRWVNEDRLAARTESDDWDKVPARGQESSDAGASVSRIVGKLDDTGAPMRAYLCRKPIEFYNEDRAKAEALTDETMTAIKGGKAGLSDAENTYIPSEGIKVSRG